ncbi:hypothetical protein ACFX1X_039088 [Malus domestica]|uniref:Uncharacterized protein n=1 Tax=Malus domestica TaxID=3750 RepID=A0A498JJ88_MALDO|nr:hypothetical protein DVH24_008479 [Malus domestica]
MKRKAVDAFRQNRNLSDSSSISTMFLDRKAQLEVPKRHAIIYSFYAPKLKRVMEVDSQRPPNPDSSRP